MPQTKKKLSPLEQQVLRTIKSHAMLCPGDHVLAAVSGGADSVAMLHVLLGLQARLQIKLSIAHMDHGIRGEKARQEARFVRGLADGLGIACVIATRDVPGYKAARSLSLQEAAREVRYGFFKEALAATGATKLALAHQADDQAETVLMRLLRGSSLRGLAGIPACRDGYIIRPLIETGRSEIEAWLQARGLSFVPDSSAGELQYLRNKIRHGLLPQLKREYNPGIVETLCRTAALLRHDEQALEDMVAKSIKRGSPGDEHTVSIASLQNAGPHLYGRLIRHILAGLKGDMRALTRRHIQAVIRLIEQPGPARVVQLPGQWCVRRQYGFLVFARSGQGRQPFYYARETIPAFLDIGEIGCRLRFEHIEKPDLNAVGHTTDTRTAYMAADKTLGTLTVRSFRPGDSFQPLGAPGRKKIARLFIDLKIPPSERSRVPVLLFGGQIAWVCGLRLAEQFKLHPGQTRALKVTAQPCEAD